MQFPPRCSSRCCGALVALGGALLAEVVLGEPNNLGIGPALPPDPRKALLGSEQHGLSSWLRDFRISIAQGSKMGVGPMGEAEILSGTCRGLRIGSVGHSDLSSNLTLGYALRVSGLGVECSIQAVFNGTLDISVRAADASMNATVQMEPFSQETMPAMPLPFGNLSLSDCSASMASSEVVFNGTSDLLDIIGRGPASDFILEMIAMTACTQVEEMVSTKGTAAMKRAAGLSQLLLEPPKALPEPAVLKQPIDWGSYPPVTVLKNLLQERFSLWSHRIVDILNVNSFDAALVSTANVTLELRQLRLTGEGAEDKPGMSVIGEQHTLGIDADFPGLAVETVVLLRVALPGQPVLNEVLTLAVGLYNASLRVRALFDEERLDHIVLDEVAKSMRCLVDCTEGVAAPPNMAIAVTELRVGLRPFLEINAFGALEKDIAGFANSLFSSLFKAYMPTVGVLTNGGLGLARWAINSMMWGDIARMAPCSEPGMLLGLHRESVDALPLVAVVVFGAGLVAAAAVHCRRSSRRSRELPRPAGAAGAGDAETRGAVGQSGGGSEQLSALSGEDRDHIPLCREPVVPPALAVLYPFAVVAVMFLYWFADFALGAVVSLVMEAEGRQTSIGPVFSFSLLSTIVDSMSSGSWVISILTLLMSGVWPHAKLFLLLVTWVAPPRRFSRRARERVLSFLDAWGKYGFLESWFLVFSMSAFAIEWESVGSNASIKVRTTPVVAFYAYFAATVLTLILGHVASEFHAMAASASTCGCASAASAPSPEAVAGDKRECAAQGLAERSGNASDSEVSSSCASVKEDTDERYPLSHRVSRTTRITVACWLGGSLALAVSSAFMISFEFSISGLFIEFLLARPVVKEYSLLSVGGAVAEGRYGSIGLVTLEIFFFLLSFVIPLVLLLTLICLWLLPLTVRGQRKLLRAGHLLDAWACLDVAVLVLAIAILQFGMMAEFLASKGSLATPCSMISSLAKEECLDIKMSARPGIAVLVLAGLALLVVPKVAMSRCQAALDGEVAPDKGEGVANCGPVIPKQPATEIS